MQAGEKTGVSDFERLYRENKKAVIRFIYGLIRDRRHART